MSKNDTIKMLRVALAKTAAEIQSGPPNPSLTKEEGLQDRKRAELLAKAGNNLQQIEASSDTETTGEATRSRLGDFLNTLLGTEYDAIFSYSYHAMRIADKELSKELLEFGLMEMEHFELIRDKVIDLGEEPRWNLSKYKESATAEPVEMLRQHLIDEEKAIELCNEGIALGFDNALEGFLKNTIEEEQQHTKRLKELIKKFEASAPD